MIKQELGPEATVLTQRNTSGFLGRLMGHSVVEVTALAQSVGVASEEIGARREPVASPHVSPDEIGPPLTPALDDYRDRLKRFAVQEQSDSHLESMIQQHPQGPDTQLSSTLFQLFADLIDADVDDRFARDFVEEIMRHSTPAQLTNADVVREKAAVLLKEQIRTTLPIETHASNRRVVALIGPTGVGKTTTIAKLAANLRLREKRRVGLITVDTYRIAAVDQLRAYADIIDLPMEVVTTPREMRDAVLKLSDLDIVLVDTAGRSPHDEIQIQELKAMLTEARADEVHLVVSGVCHSRHLIRLVEHFRPTNPTSLLLTKLDEATAYGHLLPVLCDSGLPISYTTHGQNVPDDIQPADPARLVEHVLSTDG